MRIAYIAPYQGPTVLRRRPIVRNRSMAGNTKIELISRLLQSQSHEVDVISQGEVIENSWSLYAGFEEPERFHADIPVHYASALPVRRLNGAWSNSRTLELFRRLHRSRPYDIVLIYNLKGPQLACASHAIRRLGVPVILEYEDDRFVNVVGDAPQDFLSNRYYQACARLIDSVSGGIAVSPHLLSKFPASVPSMLLRGVVAEDLVRAGQSRSASKTQTILFSGTHIASNGVAELIEGWKVAPLEGWTLHITGFGELTDSLRARSVNVERVEFHGLVSRERLIELMSSAKICVNPHAVSKTPGNVFAFKLMEYLATGAHVITTPMGTLDSDLEAGITYMPDNAPQTINTTLREVVSSRRFERTAMIAAQEKFGPAAVSRSLGALVGEVRARSATKPSVSLVSAVDPGERKAAASEK